jgi:hypothetical protein
MMVILCPKAVVAHQSEEVETMAKGETQHQPTGVSDETYDLISALAVKLEEMWRIDEFMADDDDTREKQLWQQIRDQDHAQVEMLLRALKKHLTDIGY